jgi:adenosine deaminase
MAWRYASVEALRAPMPSPTCRAFWTSIRRGQRAAEGADFFDMAWAYLEKAAAENVVHAEIFDPQTHTARGVPMQTVILGLHHACQRARRAGHRAADPVLPAPPERKDALATLEAALPWREYFIGVGLDSSERGHPPEFARVFARAASWACTCVAPPARGPPAYVTARWTC